MKAEIITKQETSKLNKYYIWIILSAAFLSVLIFILCFLVAGKSQFLFEIPHVKEDYFNGFLNEKGEQLQFRRFKLSIALASFGKEGLINVQVMYTLTFYLPAIFALAELFEIPRIKKNKINDKQVLWLSFVLMLVLINVIAQLIMFLSPNIMEITFRKYLNVYYEENFLSSTIGGEILESQIADAVQGLNEIYSNKFHILAIIIIVLCFIELIIISFFFFFRQKDFFKKRKTKIRNELIE
ncbi:hypothetical protein [Spiroplasma alleghenense]|uniref:Uncharacterized protein n=1 Tax=Spiroplasma alleghenense TaxID=216931 RepID=A0A345Z4Q1_9MOLU|nr:hypothetical protein [Spiroplasma alleghenense]AXK51580.1 hypothetical protein SALLE_v1c09100 [Spiroplasma alleghenense]